MKKWDICPINKKDICHNGIYQIRKNGRRKRIMRRRKIIALVLAGAMALSLAACGGKGNAKDGGKSNAG